MGRALHSFGFPIPLLFLPCESKEALRFNQNLKTHVAQPVSLGQNIQGYSHEPTKAAKEGRSTIHQRTFASSRVDWLAYSYLFAKKLFVSIAVTSL